ncbi:MAG: isoprenylcysteine carboxylmethyltransferase family protein [Clostridiales bacterium]|nr:isoprenylcysteine carboxylmethyltransferase family protein [Clostridiales bacterium]
MKERKHLSVWGVGPAYAVICGLLTAAGIIARNLGWLDSGAAPELEVPMTVLGAALIVAGVVLYLQAHVRTKLFDQVRQNRLITTGVYAWVRNPVYSGAMLLCTGLLLMAYNLWLLVLPPVMWLLMTGMLMATEEKWLREMYGEEYVAYCARVNRCIPWFPAKEG